MILTRIWEFGCIDASLRNGSSSIEEQMQVQSYDSSGSKSEYGTQKERKCSNCDGRFHSQYKGLLCQECTQKPFMQEGRVCYRNLFNGKRKRVELPSIPYRSRKGQLPPFLWRIPGERLFQPVFLAGMLAQKHNNIQSINASNKTPCNMKKNERKRSNDLDQRSETKSHEELYESGHVDTYEVRAGDVEVDFRTFEEVWGGYKVS